MSYLLPPPPPPKNNCRQPPRLSIIRIFVRGGLHSSLLTLTNYLTKWKSPSLHVPQPPPFNYRAYRRKWKHRWVLPEWTHNLYALVKISLGSMTALSTAFIAPCSPKLRFYVDVRVTVAVKQHRKTNRRRASSALLMEDAAYVSLARASPLIWRCLDEKFKLMFSRISLK